MRTSYILRKLYQVVLLNRFHVPIRTTGIYYDSYWSLFHRRGNSLIEIEKQKPVHTNNSSNLWSFIILI